MVMRGVGLLPEGEGERLGWAEAIAELRAERGRAEACAARARALDAATADGLAFRYAMAKAEVDAVIAGLAAALAQRGEPADLPDLEKRMAEGARLRLEFCQAVLARAPLAQGEKNVVINLLGGLVEPLTEAVKALWQWRTEHDALRRDTIRTQLEAASWPEFSAIPPVP